MARRQKLMTKEIEKLIAKYPYLSQDGKGLDAKVLVKFFLPCGGATLGYGYEFGSVSLNELENLKVKFMWSYV